MSDDASFPCCDCGRELDASQALICGACIDGVRCLNCLRQHQMDEHPREPVSWVN
jgi:hypothetical protein